MQEARAGKLGFSLFELAIVITIIAFLVAGSLTFIMAMATQQQYLETTQRMDTLQRALLNYSRSYDRLPCPADATLAVDNADFGKGVQNAADPYDCENENYSSGNSVEGMVPTKTLGLPDYMALDGWGRRVMYAVDERLTAPYAFTTFAITSTQIGSLTVLGDVAAAERTNRGAYVLYSAGQNGHGAFPPAGGVTRRTTGSANADELENCDCDSDGVYVSFNETFVQKKVTADIFTGEENYDDIVRYVNREDLRGNPAAF